MQLIRLILLLTIAASAAPMICVPQRGTCNFECVYSDAPNKIVTELRSCPYTQAEWPKAMGLDTVAIRDTSRTK